MVREISGRQDGGLGPSRIRCHQRPAECARAQAGGTSSRAAETRLPAGSLLLSFRSDFGCRVEGVKLEETRDGASGAPTVKRIPATVRLWLVLLLACAAAVTFSFARLDVPVARYFWGVGRRLNPLSEPFGSAVILSAEAGVMLVLLLARLWRGHISRFGETLAIACLTSICAYDINSNVLKILFGVPNPTAVLHGARHAFNIMRGSDHSSFPSGHMVLAGSFAGVFMRFYRASVLPLAGLLLLAAGLLVVGDWHFLSDVIAGSFLGLSVGALAAEAWIVHLSRRV